MDIITFSWLFKKKKDNGRFYINTFSAIREQKLYVTYNNTRKKIISLKNFSHKFIISLETRYNFYFHHFFIF